MPKIEIGTTVIETTEAIRIDGVEWKPVTPGTIKIGQRMRITSDAFEGQTGSIVYADGTNTVTVELDKTGGWVDKYIGHLAPLPDEPEQAAVWPERYDAYEYLRFTGTEWAVSCDRWCDTSVGADRKRLGNIFRPSEAQAEADRRNAAILAGGGF